MALVQVPIVVTVDHELDETDVLGTSEVLLRARGSNVQAISANISPTGSNNPNGSGDSAFVLFPGESIQVPSISGGASLRAKYITYQDDTNLADPVLEIIKIV